MDTNGYAHTHKCTPRSTIFFDLSPYRPPDVFPKSIRATLLPFRGGGGELEADLTGSSRTVGWAGGRCGYPLLCASLHFRTYTHTRHTHTHT